MRASHRTQSQQGQQRPAGWDQERLTTSSIRFVALALEAVSVALFVVAFRDFPDQSGRLIALGAVGLVLHPVMAALPWPDLLRRPVGAWIVRVYALSIVVVVATGFLVLDDLPTGVLLLPALILILTAWVLTVVDHAVATAIVLGALAVGAGDQDTLSLVVTLSVVGMGAIAWGAAARSLREAWARLEQEHRRAAQEAARLHAVEDQREYALSMIVHEIKNRLNVIGAASETISDRLPALSSAQVRRFAEQAREHALASARIVEALEDLATVGRADRSRFDAVRVAELADRVVASVAERAGSHRLRVDVPTDLAVSADPVLLERAVENLVANAVRHTPSGSEVTVSARPQGRGVRVVVADDGPGIDPEVRARIVEPFYRADGTGGRAVDELGLSLGLGLAIVTRALEAHGTALEVGDAEAGGAEFSFVLPDDGDPAPVILHG